MKGFFFRETCVLNKLLSHQRYFQSNYLKYFDSDKLGYLNLLENLRHSHVTIFGDENILDKFLLPVIIKFVQKMVFTILFN